RHTRFSRDWSSDVCSSDLDPNRLQSLVDPGALARLDLVQVLRDGKAALFAANLGLAAYQRRLAEQLGIEPGAELKAAAQEAQAQIGRASCRERGEVTGCAG